jgi:hypothetical protein
MPGDALKKVKSGDRLAIPAATFNTFIDAANDFRRRQQDGGGGPAADRPREHILVRNDSGEDLDRFGILGGDAPVILPADNLDEFKNRVVLSGVTPTADHAGRFAVLQEPLADGAIGRACVCGVSPVQVDVIDENHGFAEVEEGETGSLQSAESGSATLLYKESGTGLKWAVVQLGDPVVDEKAKVSSNDTTAGYLNGKLVAGAGITLTEKDDGEDESLEIAAGKGSWRWWAWTYDDGGAHLWNFWWDMGGAKRLCEWYPVLKGKAKTVQAWLSTSLSAGSLTVTVRRKRRNVVVPPQTPDACPSVDEDSDLSVVLDSTTNCHHEHGTWSYDDDDLLGVKVVRDSCWPTGILVIGVWYEED